jgi:undecaprenyl-diphosphatase
MDSFIIFLGKDLIVGVVILALVVWFKQTDKLKKELAVALIMAGIAAWLLSKIAGALYYHPRPFIVEHIKPLIAHGNDNGFPSEHTVLATSLTSLIYFYDKKLALAALILTLAMAAGRVWAHVHSPLDIAGGLLVGGLAGWLGYQIVKKLRFSRATAKAVSKS